MFRLRGSCKGIIGSTSGGMDKWSVLASCGLVTTRSRKKLGLGGHSHLQRTSGQFCCPQMDATGPHQECKVQVKPWFVGSKKRYDKIQLIFYGKREMHVVKRVVLEMGWKVHLILQNDEAGARELQQMTSDPQIFTVLYTHSKSFKEPVVQDLANSTDALVSAINKSFTITGGKKGQLVNLRLFLARCGCNLNDMQLIPRSFILDDPRDYAEFLKYSQLKPLSWWILKPSVSHGGGGITIHKDAEQIHKAVVSPQTKKHYIVQEYLSNPLLIEGRKFDVRAFILIAGTSPYILFYHEGFLKRCVEKFDMVEEGVSMHVTNTCVQKLVENFSMHEHLWSFQALQDYLDAHHPENDNFVSNRLEPYMKKVGLLIMQTGLSIFERNPSAFHLIGLDFMVTDDFRVWFIEANSYPGWPKASRFRPYSISFIDEHMDTLGRDMFDLLFALREDPKHFHKHLLPGQYFKSFQLIWSEAESSTTYDPCSQFFDSELQ